MKTVIITGSGRGLGLEMAKVFRKNNYNVVLSDINEQNLKSGVEKLKVISSKGNISGFICNVSILEEVEKLFLKAKEEYKEIDIWINNAGVNQPNKYAWELTESQIQILIDVDLKGAINGTNVALRNMKEQGFGAIYNVEGFGSNDAYQDFLAIYGTTKRAVTYFTQAVAHEIDSTKTNVIIGRLSPGIMITDFITSQAGSKDKITLSDKVKKVYNILGDYPDVVARFLVTKMIENKKNNVQISWLTNFKAFKRFMLAGFNKRDFFK